MIILALRIENRKSPPFKPKLQAFEIAIIKKGDFKSFYYKIISGKYF